jgi:Zn finger protein HypA/HybF involved in hydrogenase expression
MRMDYSKYFWCARCDIKVPKNDGVGLCPECRKQMRRTPRNHIRKDYIADSSRML